MKRLVLAAVFGLVVLLGFAACPVSAGDAQGWQAAKWGMTPEQVKRALKYPLRSIEHSCSGCDFVTLLQIDQYPVAGQPFHVRFHFGKTDQRLTGVSMHADKRSERGGDSFGVQFAIIRDLLIKNYGEPAKSSHSRTGIETNEVLWVFPSTTIELFLSHAPGAPRIGDVLSITYDAKRAGEAGKL